MDWLPLPPPTLPYLEVAVAKLGKDLLVRNRKNRPSKKE